MRGYQEAIRRRRWMYDDERVQRNTEFLSFGISDDPEDFAPLLMLYRACGESVERYRQGGRCIYEPLEVFDRLAAVDNGLVPMLHAYFLGEQVEDIINW